MIENEFETIAIDVNVIYEVYPSFKELYDKLETYDRNLLVKTVDDVVNKLLTSFIAVVETICENSKKKGIN